MRYSRLSRTRSPGSVVWSSPSQRRGPPARSYLAKSLLEFRAPKAVVGGRQLSTRSTRSRAHRPDHVTLLLRRRTPSPQPKTKGQPQGEGLLVRLEGRLGHTSVAETIMTRSVRAASGPGRVYASAPHARSGRPADRTTPLTSVGPTLPPGRTPISVRAGRPLQRPLTDGHDGHAGCFVTASASTDGWPKMVEPWERGPGSDVAVPP